MTREQHYKRNWTPGPRTRYMIDHTAQPRSFMLKIYHRWVDQAGKDDNGNYFYVLQNGKRVLISQELFKEIDQLNKNSANLERKMFRTEIHFCNMNYTYMNFKMIPRTAAFYDSRRETVLDDYLNCLTSKQRFVYREIMRGTKQQDIAKKLGITKTMVSKHKRAIIRKFRKRLAERRLENARNIKWSQAD